MLSCCIHNPSHEKKGLVQATTECFLVGCAHAVSSNDSEQAGETQWWNNLLEQKATEVGNTPLITTPRAHKNGRLE